MVLRVLIGAACVAVIGVSLVWMEDRFGVLEWATKREKTVPELVACMKMEREWRELSASSASRDRLASLEARYDAECSD